MRDGDFGNTGLVRMTPEWCQALGLRQGVRRNRRVPAIAVLEMVQDLADDAGLGDERDDTHSAAAVLRRETGTDSHFYPEDQSAGGLD